MHRCGMDARHKAAKLAEIKRHYKRRPRRQRPSMAALRVNDLTKLIRGRHGHTLPNDAAGRDAAFLMVHHLQALSGDPRRRITTWLNLLCPWMALAEAAMLLEEAVLRPMRWKADKLGWRLKLLEADRRAMGITTIGAIDLPRPERLKRRKARARLAQQARRRARGAKPRAQYLAAVKAAPKPWQALGISRQHWFRLGRPAPPM